MLIRSQDGKRIVETGEVWIQRHADRIIEHHYLFAATEIDPEGIILGQYDTEGEAIAVMTRVLAKGELGEAIDLYRETIDPMSAETLREAIERVQAATKARPEMICLKCNTVMVCAEGSMTCPTCGVTV